MTSTPSPASVSRWFFVSCLAFLSGFPARALGAQDAATAPPAAGPVLLRACYDPAVGALYLIRLPGLADRCLKPSHQEIALRGAMAGDSLGVMTPPTGPAGGDLSGSYPDPVVVRLQTKPISATPPTAGQVLAFAGGTWTPTTPSFNGDVTGGLNSMRVVKLQNRALSPTAPASGQVLQWDATALAWTPATPAAGVTQHNQLLGLTNDDHPQYLLLDGVRNATKGFVVTGTNGAGAPPPLSGPGSRFMWYADRRATRGGTACSTEWDQANIGGSSTAFGECPRASGFASTALGRLTIASATEATAFGSESQALMPYSIAGGQLAQAQGNNSIALGFFARAGNDHATALGFKTTASGMKSFAVGDSARATSYAAVAGGNWVLASGSQSTAFGSLTQASGVSATALGEATVASGNQSIAMGHATTASGDRSTAMGHWASTNGMSGSFVYGDFTAIGTINSVVPNEFAVRASGGFRFRTAADLSTGCSLAAGSGSWNCTSSKSQKTDFADVNGDALLTKVRALPVQTWRYTTEDTTVRHMGPYAEDFRAAFRLGADSTTIGHIDVSGVALAAAKALEARTRILSGALEARDRELAELRNEMAGIRADRAELIRRLGELERSTRSHGRRDGSGVAPRLDPRANRD